jgi:hypothetical protein
VGRRPAPCCFGLSEPVRATNWHVHGPRERAHQRYWTIRAWAEGWVLLLIRRGPRAFWGGLTHAPYRSSLRFGFSTVAQGHHPEPDVAVMLTPPRAVEPDPSIISPRQVRNFVRAVAPGAPPDPRLDALVALEEEHGSPTLTGDPVSDAAGAHTCGPYLRVDSTGRLSFRTRSIHRPPFEDAHLFEDPFSDSEPLFLDEDPSYDTDPLFDVVDVMLPLYLAATAISSGAYDRLLHLRGGSKRRHYSWGLEIEERIAFPTPRGGPSAVGFPGRIPGRVPFVGVRPEPSTAWVWGRNVARTRCRPERLVESVLAELLEHWGYENDPVVVAEVLSALHRRCAGSLVGQPR